MATQANQEIERKWVLAKLPDNLPDTGLTIIQGYLSVAKLETCQLRLRSCRHQDGHTDHILTYKNGKGLTRVEWEQQIPEKVFNSLWPGAQWRLAKCRYQLRHQDWLLEFDRYTNPELSGLLIMECEFPSEAAAWQFTPPDWLELAFEATDDERYSNLNLARHGLPD